MLLLGQSCPLHKHNRHLFRKIRRVEVNLDWDIANLSSVYLDYLARQHTLSRSP